MKLSLAEPRKSPFSLRNLTILAAVLALCLGGLAWYFTQALTLEGRARENVTSLAARMTGVVDAVLVRPGDPVDVGDTLLMLESRQLREKLLQEQETLLLRQAAVPPQKLRQKTALASAGVAQPHSAGNQPEDPARALEKRLKELRKAETEAGELVRDSSAIEARAAYVKNQASARANRGQATRAQVEEASQAYTLARKILEEAKIAFEEHSLARARVEAELKQLREARQDPNQKDEAEDILLRAYEVQLERVRLASENLATARVVAPEAGIIAAVLTEPGAEVLAGQRVAYLLPKESRPRIMARASEKEAAGIFVNDPCRVRVPSAPEGPFTGVVEAVYPAPRELLLEEPEGRKDDGRNMVVQVRLVAPVSPGRAASENATLDGASLPMLPEGTQAFVEFARR